MFRKGFKYGVLFLAFFLFVNQNSYAQNSFLGYFFKSEKQQHAQIPFKLVSNLIIVKVQIDNSDTLNFILDTGFRSILITELKVLDKINLNHTRKIKLIGIGNQSEIFAQVSVGHTVKINNILAYNQPIIFFEEDILKLSELLGIPVHGIFGKDIFDNFITLINYSSQTITFYTPNNFKFRKKYGQRFPIEIINSKPYFSGVEYLNKTRFAPIKLMIDTGASHALLLDKNANDSIKLPKKTLKTNLGFGINGKIDGFLGRINEIKIGECNFKNILTSFPESYAFSQKFTDSLHSCSGSIGGEILKRYQILFNYPENYIALKPDKSKIKQPFEHDMSGITLVASGENLRRFVVSEIEPNSAADFARLQVGDELLYINNQKIDNFDLNDIYKILTKKEGDVIDLVINRAGKLKYISIKLRRMI